MKTTDIRDTNFAKLCGGLDRRRAHVLAELAEIGRAVTTRQLAEVIRWDLLSVRPRVTELRQLGLVVCTGRAGGEGLYRVASQTEWEAEQARLRAGVSRQLVADLGMG